MPQSGPRAAERAETIALLGALPAPTPEPAMRPTSRRVTGPHVSVSTGPAKRCPKCGERFPLDYRVCPRDVVELEVEVDDDRDPYVGTTLAQTYRIVRRIGVGGMGAVYEACHTRLTTRKFAIKVMHDELVRKGDLAARFRREAEVAGMASHPSRSPTVRGFTSSILAGRSTTTPARACSSWRRASS